MRCVMMLMYCLRFFISFCLSYRFSCDYQRDTLRMRVETQQKRFHPANFNQRWQSPRGREYKIVTKSHCPRIRDGERVDYKTLESLSRLPGCHHFRAKLGGCSYCLCVALLAAAGLLHGLSVASKIRCSQSMFAKRIQSHRHASPQRQVLGTQRRCGRSKNRCLLPQLQPLCNSPKLTAHVA